MKRILPIFSILVTFTVLFQSCQKDELLPPIPVSDQTSTFNAEPAVEWMQLAYKIVQIENIPAPVCSRFYGYWGISIYEAVHWGMDGYKSLAGQLRDMPQMPQPANEVYDWPAVMTATLKIVALGTLYQPQQHSIDMVNELYDKQIQERIDSAGQSIVDRSINYGTLLGDAIVQWSNSDNFLATRDKPYTPPSRSENPANWETTLPGGTPIEPWLGTQKPFCMVTQNECAVPLGIPFDTIPGTDFYNDGLEVFNSSQTLTQEQRNIAFFWEDKIGTGQPPGHWVAITNFMVKQFSLKLDEAAKIYALVGAAVRDAFISCWEAKYRVNLLRPKTYIRDYLGQPNWSPIVVTPLFPEYPSGHSVVSGAVSEILTNRFGDNVAFVDSSHDNLAWIEKSYI